MQEPLLPLGLFQALTNLAHLVGAWLTAHAFNIIVILAGAWLLRRFGVQLLSQLLRRTIRSDLYPTAIDREKRVRTLDSLIGAAVRLAVYIIAALLLIAEINPRYTTALFASAGLLSVALAFGAQSLIRDFMSGIFIITENQYRVGDVVAIGEVSGTVEAITIRTTIVRDSEGFVHYVPNGKIDITTNKSTGDRRVISELITVPLDTDLGDLERIVARVGKQIAGSGLGHLLLKPLELERLEGFSKGGLSIRLKAVTTPAGYFKIRSQLYRCLGGEFSRHKIKPIS